MRTAGKFLIFSAVFLRAVVVLSGAAEFRGILVLLSAYGVLMATEAWLVHQSKRPELIKSPGMQFAYLCLQAILVLGLLLVSDYEDFLAELFIPISLDAVSVFGRRVGMSEHAREMGWTLAVESPPGRGTCVRISESPTEK